MTGGRVALGLIASLAVACGGGQEDAEQAAAGSRSPPAEPVEDVPLGEAPEAAVELAAVMDPNTPVSLRVTGDDYRWLVRYAGPDGVIDTTDDVLTQQNLHLPAGREVFIDLASHDFVYTFYVPRLDIMEVAVPGEPFEIDLDTGRAGVHDLLGSQMCGFTHPLLIGDVVIEEWPEFVAWLETTGN